MTDKKDFNLADPILALPRPVKRFLVLFVDAVLCVLTVWLAFFLRLDEWVRLFDDPFWRADIASAVSLVFALPLFVTHGFYRVIFRHANLIAVSFVARAFILYTLAFGLVVTIIGVPGVPRTIGIIQPILLLLAVGLSRAVAAYWLGGAYRDILKRLNLPKVLIYGAGAAGRQLLNAMTNTHDMRVVGFLDDDPSLQGQTLNGLRVYAPTDFASIVSENGISTVLLALPSISRHRRNEILATIKAAKVAVRTLPSVTDLVQGRVTVSDLRELDIEDLLSRDPVPPDQTLLGKNIHAKVVLVTGAGGSIGSELCRQIAAVGPKKLVLFEQSEHALYQIHAELERRLMGHQTELIALLGNVQDMRHMAEVMTTIKPHTVYHAAAYKHVPLVEHNSAEGLRNNVFGTLITAQAAIAADVADFVLISTDKAVRPTNVMGASKRLAEMVLQALAADLALGAKTRLSMVRFGNVLGSSGSVVPKFRQQIRDGGPVTLTHAEVTRYFMTIPEAAQLVIQAGAMAQGGDVYVLEMGEPIKIYDLAKRMIELSGLTLKDVHNPTGDIEIQITGLRPGEKLYEELLIGDNPQTTPHPRIMRASEEFLKWTTLQGRLNVLAAQLQVSNPSAITELLRELVTGYQPQLHGSPTVGSRNLEINEK
jgi:FlaA1/EpsC-like NDP-sugar epimerase